MEDATSMLGEENQISGASYLILPVLLRLVPAVSCHTHSSAKPFMTSSARRVIVTHSVSGIITFPRLHMTIHKPWRASPAPATLTPQECGGGILEKQGGFFFNFKAPLWCPYGQQVRRRTTTTGGTDGPIGIRIGGFSNLVKLLLREHMEIFLSHFLYYKKKPQTFLSEFPPILSFWLAILSLFYSIYLYYFF